MVQAIQRLSDIADQFDAIVLDQWGVLHDGTRPYPNAVHALADLKAKGTRLAVLSNSGKRSALNAARIAAMGFPAELFECVMTSGEALWRDLQADQLPGRAVFAITADPSDAMAWRDGLDLTYVESLSQADFVLLMGRPDFGDDAAAEAQWLSWLESEISQRGLKVYCTNPDRASPRAGGRVVASPGAIAHDWAAKGIDVTFYGKPHAPVFQSIETALNVKPDRLLMVGDSLEHDIAGGHAAGWSTLFIQGGLYAATFEQGDPVVHITALAQSHDAPMPTFTLTQLR